LKNLLDFFKEVYEGIDEGQSVDVIYLNFAKAFDKVPNKIHSGFGVRLVPL